MIRSLVALILVLVLNLACDRGYVAQAHARGLLQGGTAGGRVHRRQREHGGDATEAERAALPSVTPASRAAMAARFEALEASVSAPDRAAPLSDTSNAEGGQGRMAATPLEVVTSQYLSNEGVFLHLRDYVERCGHISRLVRIGTSEEGMPIEALEISNTVDAGLKDGKPHVKLVATIHGDETAGLPTTLGIAEWLCANHETDADAMDIVEGAHVWVLPVMNPDGYEAVTRYNANGRDINRDFPDQFRGGMCMCPAGRQAETKTIMEWTDQNPFVSSLVFHGGALVVNYPLDGTPDGRTRYMAAADDGTFKHLAHIYADNHPILHTMRRRGFSNGITNGASWYTIYGGMQDYNYLQGQTMELTIELDDDKSPPVSKLPTIYEQNKQSIVEFIRATTVDALRGRVTASSSGARGRPLVVGLKGASVSIKGIDSSVTSRDGGYFTRPLNPGKYTLVVEKKGYKTQETEIRVTAGDAPDLLITLEQDYPGKKKKKGDAQKNKKKKPGKKKKKKGDAQKKNPKKDPTNGKKKKNPDNK